MLYNVSYRIVQNTHDAQDIVQDSLIKAFKNISKLDEEAHLGGWLKRIAVNTSIDFVRKKKRQVWIDERFQIEDKEEHDTEASFVETLESVELIKNCLNSLKDKYRIILNLYLIEDYNHREISELLHLKESTVRNQYRRGKNLLLQEIQKHSPDGLKRTHTE